MKVLTRVEIDIETGEVLAEESHNYEGPVALCDFGGGDVSAGYEALAKAYREAAKVAREMFDLSARMGDPWRLAGQGALGALTAFMGIPYSPGPGIPYDVLATYPTPGSKGKIPGSAVGGTPTFGGAGGGWPLKTPGGVMGPRFGATTTAATYDPTAMLMRWPGYQWSLQQGLNALERSAAARGMGLSGAALKGITNYAQQAAIERALWPYLSMLSNLSGGGLTAATGLGSMGIQTGQIIGQNLVGAGQAQLAGALAQAQQNASFWNSLLGTIGTIGGSLLGSVFGPVGSSIGGALGGYVGGGFIPSSHVNVPMGVPGMREGGPVEAGKPYLVGEEGPEVFVPERPGFIIPNEELQRMSALAELHRKFRDLVAAGKLRVRYHPEREPALEEGQ